MRHVVWQLADVELHVIMQLVTVDDCASRILAAASAPGGPAKSIAAVKRSQQRSIARPRMTASVGVQAGP
jgi:hypothetical protein